MIKIEKENRLKISIDRKLEQSSFCMLKNEIIKMFLLLTH